MKKTISYNKFIRNTIIISMSLIVSLFILYGTYIQSSSIEKSIKNDAGVMADLVFQNLYTVMKNGGNKESLSELVRNLEHSIPSANINIIKPNESSSSFVKDVFENKKADISRHEDNVIFASPIIYAKECLQCHTSSKEGETAAVLLMEYPILNLQISLKEILVMASILFLLVIIVFFSMWYVLLKKYFVKPIKSLIFQMNKITNHNDLEKKVLIDTSIKEVKEIEQAFNRQNEELILSYNNLEKISNTDSLTGIYNRKKFDEYSELLIKNTKRYSHNLSLIVIDLNKFKYVNDTFGHHIGDDILVLFTKLVSESIRESDYFFRTGGDEFVLLLPETSAIEASVLIEKISTKLENNLYTNDELCIEIQASFGCAEYGVDGQTVQGIIAIADDRMYEDKKQKKLSR
ncbi:MAG: GGDEF domain-containing protein [Poseidonibacter sp.]|uniref:GGDEF domain-containing protein n=1 Tax=Poseidonibacter sp. TaxID=2321188 RepID=UPI00359CF3AB